jgi:hypothetical protein
MMSTANIFRTVEAQRIEISQLQHAVKMLAQTNAQQQAAAEAIIGQWQRTLAAAIHAAGDELRIPKGRLEFTAGWNLTVAPDTETGDLLLSLSWPPPPEPKPDPEKNGMHAGALVVPGA